VPRYAVGDSVRVIGPGADRGKTGVVIQVSDHVGDFVHRYEVRFPDGTSKKCFGFELDFILSESA